MTNLAGDLPEEPGETSDYPCILGPLWGHL